MGNYFINKMLNLANKQNLGKLDHSLRRIGILKQF